LRQRTQRANKVDHPFNNRRFGMIRLLTRLNRRRKPDPHDMADTLRHIRAAEYDLLTGRKRQGRGST